MSAALPQSLHEHRLLRHGLALLTFAAAAASATWAQQSERPITTAIIFLFGVTLVGALEGLWGGLLAALAASAIYNFFLSDPVFSFSLTSADEYVPLIAFNTSAAASALLAGRLRDRARAAELGERRMRALLDVSERLQPALRVEDVAAAIQGFADETELFLIRNGEIAPVSGGGRHIDLARAAAEAGHARCEDGRRAVVLKGAAGPSAVLVLPDATLGIPSDGIATVVAIALERCLLLEQVADAELVRRSEEFKTALLSSVSHDMRTPLGSISASASSLALYGDQLPGETQADLLRLIQEQCARLDRYTTNLLNLGRIQAGLATEGWSSCDAVEVLGTALANIRSLGTGHRIVKDYGTASASVRGDPVMLEQVFYNVLENAVRYSPDGSAITITVSEEAERLVVLIADEGEGIAAADRARVFERFARSSTASREGRGLGLSIAKGFTDAFGGSIQALPNEPAGKGTCIRIALMLDQEAAQR